MVRLNYSQVFIQCFSANFTGLKKWRISHYWHPMLGMILSTYPVRTNKPASKARIGQRTKGPYHPAFLRLRPTAHCKWWPELPENHTAQCNIQCHLAQPRENLTWYYKHSESVAVTLKLHSAPQSSTTNNRRAFKGEETPYPPEHQINERNREGREAA